MTSIYPLGQPEEEFGSEQRVLHLATVSKKGAVHTYALDRLQHEITAGEIQVVWQLIHAFFLEGGTGRMLLHNRGPGALCQRSTKPAASPCSRQP
jgi:hypothetical protein